jgi:regulator of sigma E protease
MTRASSKRGATSSATRRCPRWGGLKVPPKIPTLNATPSSKKGLVFANKDSILKQNDFKEESFSGIIVLVIVMRRLEVLDAYIGPIVMLAALIFVHELGHFLVAKAVGIKVLKFSLGFPPNIIKRKWGETDYCLGAIPLGGYVKLLGEDADSEEEITPEDQARAYPNKPVLHRMAVIAAGPLSNYLMAVVLLIVGYMAGMPVLLAEIGKVLPNTPAASAGLKPGDRILAIDGKPAWRFEDMRSIIEKHPEQRLVLTVQRDGKELEVPITPALSEQKSMFGEDVGRIGVAPSGKSASLGMVESVSEGVRTAGRLTEAIGTTLVMLVKRQLSVDSLGGPLIIVQASGESLKAGPFSFLLFLSYISINLAIINLLPIPILDGGHLLFLSIEAIIGKPVTGKARELAVQAGVLLILFLMILVFYNDIHRIVTKGWTLAP